MLAIKYISKYHTIILRIWLTRCGINLAFIAYYAYFNTREHLFWEEGRHALLYINWCASSWYCLFRMSFEFLNDGLMYFLDVGIYAYWVFVHLKLHILYCWGNYVTFVQLLHFERFNSLSFLLLSLCRNGYTLTDLFWQTIGIVGFLT